MPEEKNIIDDFNIENAPHLSKIGKINAFEVPEGYFEKLPSVIMHKCIVTNKEKKFGLILKPKYIVQFSMVALFIILGAYFLIKYDAFEPDTKCVSKNSRVVHQNEVTFYDDETDENELIEVIANNTESDIQIMSTDDISLLTTDDIINYLIEDVDFDTENEF